MRFQKSIVFVMTVLNAHSDVVHALPEYSQSGTYGERLYGRDGERINARAESTSLSEAESQPTVKLSRDPGACGDKGDFALPRDLDATSVDKRVPPLPEDLKNFVDWFTFAVVGTTCISAVVWAGHKLFIHFTTDAQRVGWIDCMAYVLRITPAQLRDYLNRLEREGVELREQVGA